MLKTATIVIFLFALCHDSPMDVSFVGSVSGLTLSKKAEMRKQKSDIDVKGGRSKANRRRRSCANQEIRDCVLEIMDNWPDIKPDPDVKEGNELSGLDGPEAIALIKEFEEKGSLKKEYMRMMINWLRMQPASDDIFARAPPQVKRHILSYMVDQFRFLLRLDYALFRGLCYMETKRSFYTKLYRVLLQGKAQHSELAYGNRMLCHCSGVDDWVSRQSCIGQWWAIVLHKRLCVLNNSEGHCWYKEKIMNEEYDMTSLEWLKGIIPAMRAIPIFEAYKDKLTLISLIIETMPN